MSKEKVDNYEEEINYIDLMDEDGKKYTFEELLVFDVDEDSFIAMLPTESYDEFETDEVLIMRLKETEDGELSYLPVDSQEELDMLWDIFQEMYYEDDEDAEEEIKK